MTARPSLLERLDAGDPLHREAAAVIRQLRRDLNEEIREGNRAARDAYSEGRRDGRNEEGGGW